MITLPQILDHNPRQIWFSANTVWWTHDPRDIQKGLKDIPADCFGSPLMMITEHEAVVQFLNITAVDRHPQYGKKEHRRRNWLLTHAQNIGPVIGAMALQYPGELPPKDLICSYLNFCQWCDSNITMEIKPS